MTASAVRPTSRPVAEVGADLGAPFQRHQVGITFACGGSKQRLIACFLIQEEIDQTLPLGLLPGAMMRTAFLRSRRKADNFIVAVACARRHGANSQLARITVGSGDRAVSSKVRARHWVACYRDQLRA
jgi:hypothetical protein